jgi:Myb-like DNA-binding domain
VARYFAQLFLFPTIRQPGTPSNVAHQKVYLNEFTFPNFLLLQCKSRWTKIDPKVSKCAFKPEEDAVILDGKEMGLSWSDIAKQLPGRSTDQVRSRFLNAIDPSLRKHISWTAEEEEILRLARLEVGNKWSVIAQYLPGRSENDVKNHWYGQKLKATRQLKSMAADKKRKADLSRLRIDTSLQDNGSDSDSTSTSA